MAEAKSSEIVNSENEEPEAFHDIDCHNLNPPESNALALHNEIHTARRQTPSSRSNN